MVSPLLPIVTLVPEGVYLERSFSIEMSAVPNGIANEPPAEMSVDKLFKSIFSSTQEVKHRHPAMRKNNPVFLRNRCFMLSVCVWCLGGKSKKNNINILCVIELQALKYYSFVCF